MNLARVFSCLLAVACIGSNSLLASSYRCSQVDLFSITTVGPNSGSNAKPQSRAERTDYRETSRYSDVIEFIDQLQLFSRALKLEYFGTTNAGRALPLVILSAPRITTPGEALRSAKPIVLVMANIHGGEVEGKEASLHLMRELVIGDLQPMLEKMIVLIAPIYNADGNEQISINNRTAQNGPLGGVGVRENGQKLDLNRDFMKLDSPEAQGLVQNVLTRWDPHLVIDLHTTNGSHHGYALTYSPSLNPNTDMRLISFARDHLLPTVRTTLNNKYGYRSYYYGNFTDREKPGRELPADRPIDPKAWATFDHRPRFGNNYVGLRNRLAILSEAYSYLDFRKRVDVTEKFIRSILEYVAASSDKLVGLISAVDAHAVRTGTTGGNEEGFGIAFELKASPDSVEILVGSVTRTVDERNGRPRFEATDQTRLVRMIEYGEFTSTRRVEPPAAYIFRPENNRIADILVRHGITVEVTRREVEIDVGRYTVTNVSRSERPFQGHRETRIAVAPGTSREIFPQGSYLVSMHQPTAALVFYLLEPESDDGVANWNFFTEQLKENLQGSPIIYPIYRVTQPPAIPLLLFRRAP